MSDIELLSIHSVVRLVACSKPVKSLMLDFLAERWVKFAISVVVIVSPDALPSLSLMAARRLGSGISTVCAVAVMEIEKQINRNNKVQRKGSFVMDLFLPSVRL